MQNYVIFVLFITVMLWFVLCLRSSSALGNIWKLALQVSVSSRMNLANCGACQQFCERYNRCVRARARVYQ